MGGYGVTVRYWRHCCVGLCHMYCGVCVVDCIGMLGVYGAIMCIFVVGFCVECGSTVTGMLCDWYGVVAFMMGLR